MLSNITVKEIEKYFVIFEKSCIFVIVKDIYLYGKRTHISHYP